MRMEEDRNHVRVGKDFKLCANFLSTAARIQVPYSCLWVSVCRKRGEGCATNSLLCTLMKICD